MTDIPAPAPTYVSHELMRSELARRGYKVHRLELGEKYTYYTARSGRSWLTRDATLSYPFINGSARLICKDKRLSQLLASTLGVAIPQTLVYPEDMGLIAEFLNRNAPLVVKPMDSFGSRGLRLSIQDAQTLDAAITEARTYSSRVLIQPQFTGEEVRITICKGKVVVAILRETPKVTGDGQSTVATLIKEENDNRAQLALPYITYPQLSAENISPQWLTEDRVPENGETVELSRSTLVRTGASLFNITDDLHVSYKSMATMLANILNPDFLCIDLMIHDYRREMRKDNYIFLEFTTSPALKMYYSMRDGKQHDMIRTLADMIDGYCA